MVTRLQETNRFEAVGRSGHTYTIIESTSQTALDAMNGGDSGWTNGSIYLRALYFGPVSQINESEFLIFLNGEKVKKL
ncbi:hypothetical protein [Pseudomonas fluorescens]|uniref:Uncharacterized protein n=1 Tax=Pseudomonas fluorescens TaxID=294 RepID=A0A5E7EWW3_PSEFL|nr:hypothetical protein [Pseudomonas fluorescens]VVO30992.1 hypothetical protein PS723_04990 [Pseudomonas fluorescens]